MTTREARGLAAVDGEEESVADYLQRNPEFFERHQAVLARLRCRTRAAARPSRWSSGRSRCCARSTAALEGKLAELVRVARANDAIAERLHRFTRRLLRSVAARRGACAHRGGPARGFRCLPRRAGAGRRSARSAAPRFVRACAADDPNLKSFESLFASGKPRCGQARDSQREFLFGPEGLRDRIGGAGAARRQGRARPAGARQRRPRSLSSRHEHRVPGAPRAS